jgi:pyruvate formate lyase activating enzyme
MAKLGFALQLAPSVACGAGLPDRGVQLPPAEAEYFTRNADGSVTCALCPHHETLQDGQMGRCRARANVRGTLKTYGVGQPCVVNVDPIEKNPLNHVFPGSNVLSIAHAGCNLRCQYCQNWQFSQESPRDTRNLKFDQGETLGLTKSKDIRAITFTYTEGTSHIEFNKRFAAAARKLGLRVYLCTNGCIQPKPLADFLEVLDGVTVTIKGFTDEFYQTYIGAASCKPVLESSRQIKAAGKWIEVATLIVPGLNDAEEELRGIARWVRQGLGADTPWHLERFTPKYKLMNRPQTPAATLEKAVKIGQGEGLRFVYVSNLAPHPGNNTSCPRCHKPVIKRLGFKVLSNDLRGGKCPYCQTAIPGVWA